MKYIYHSSITPLFLFYTDTKTGKLFMLCYASTFIEKYDPTIEDFYRKEIEVTYYLINILYIHSSFSEYVSTRNFLVLLKMSLFHTFDIARFLHLVLLQVYAFFSFIWKLCKYLDHY
uniref:Uncharacterized protein n=1 Tax=Heterorhabditis bacteriophora TaxID=37862 RepID=A0A1I7WR14_HETBA